MADDALLEAAWKLPVAAIYRQTTLEQQKARSLCGPTSLANALRSFGGEVDRAALLDGTGVATLFGFRLGGMTLEQLLQVVAAKSARRATIVRDQSIDAFRDELRRSNDPARRYVVNFDRRGIFGWGGGHHSPIAGWLEPEDRVLVLDVNRRVGPFLVDSARLHEAVRTIDPASGNARGLLLIE